MPGGKSDSKCTPSAQAGAVAGSPVRAQKFVPIDFWLTGNGIVGADFTSGEVVIFKGAKFAKKAINLKKKGL